MAGGMSFPETMEIETPERGYNSDFVKKFDKDIHVLISELQEKLSAVYMKNTEVEDLGLKLKKKLQTWSRNNE